MSAALCDDTLRALQKVADLRVAGNSGGPDHWSGAQTRTMCLGERELTAAMMKYVKVFASVQGLNVVLTTAGRVELLPSAKASGDKARATTA